MELEPENQQELFRGKWSKEVSMSLGHVAKVDLHRISYGVM